MQGINARDRWNVKFMYRKSNEASNVLDKETLSLHSELAWIEEATVCIRSIIEKEKSCNEASLIE